MKKKKTDAATRIAHVCVCACARSPVQLVVVEVAVAVSVDSRKELVNLTIIRLNTGDEGEKRPRAYGTEKSITNANVASGAKCARTAHRM
eukprot:3877716-Pleurochrysis_carterae.AAC.2